MAVVARQARPYTEMAAAALERFGVPVTVRRRYTLREIPVVRALCGALQRRRRQVVPSRTRRTGRPAVLRQRDRRCADQRHRLRSAESSD